jgi:hypothetical protein
MTIILEGQIFKDHGCNNRIEADHEPNVSKAKCFGKEKLG